MIRAQPTEDGCAHITGRARGGGGIAAGRLINPGSSIWFRACAEFNSLIVESVPSCIEALRSMIDIYDRIREAERVRCSSPVLISTNCRMR